MRYRAIVLLEAASLGLVGCAAQDGLEPSSTLAQASAEARNPAGTLMAQATASEVGEGVRVRVEASGLAPGSYGAHVHAIGACDPPGYDSAGPHWNPTNREHGTQNPQGAHMGDLPNLLVGADGRGSFEMTIAGAQVSGGARAMLDGDGAAIVIHAGPDDYRTDPSGNSGARIACGVFA